MSSVSLHTRRGKAAGKVGGAFRPDIEGMRAVAILAVVGYHGGLAGFGGGYVGVDVFFVLSGFLITGVLWRPLAEARRLRLAEFYARRARRLLPSSLLVIVATVLASVWLLPPLEVASVGRDGLSAIGYVANYRFALRSTDYLHNSGAVSPLQHFWSLGVEEQFYLVWPAVLMGASRWSSRRHGRARVGAGAWALGALAVCSFALSWWLTGRDQPWAFFSLPTRAWELAVGGLLALWQPWLRRMSRRFSTALGWSGLATVVATVVALPASAPFPGIAALAPVLGTAAVVAAGSAYPRTGPGSLLSSAPLQFLGRHSYTWYLWHWPVLILGAAAMAGHPSLGPRTGLVLASLALAVLTSRLVERPVRFSSWLAARPHSTLAGGGILMAVSGSTVVLAYSLTVVPIGHRLAPLASPPAVGGHPAPASPSAPAESTTTTAPRTDPLAAARATAAASTAAVAGAVASSAGALTLPSNLDPPLAAASASQALPFRDGCFDTFTDAKVHACRYGRVGAGRTMAVFGDSHAMMWYPAFERIASTRGWQLDMFGKGTCPAVDAPLFSAELGRPFYECEQWRTAVLARLRSERPALVVLAMTRNYGGPYVLRSYSQAWMRGLAAMVGAIRAMGSQVVVLGPVPQPPSNVPDCLAAHPTDIAACALGVKSSLNAAGIAGEQATVSAAGGEYLDVRPWFCTATICPVVVDNLLVFRDMSHITVPYATYLAGALDATLYALTDGTV